MNNILITNISDKYAQLEEFFRPLAAFFNKIKNHVLRDSSELTLAISEVSQQAIVSLIKADCTTKLHEKQITVSPNIITQLQNQAYTLLLNESKVSDEQILDECYLQVECVKDKKSIIEVKASMAFTKVFPQTVQFFHNIFDTALRVLGFYDIGQEIDDMKAAHDRLNLYMKILAFPAILFTLAAQVASVGVALAVTATVIAATTLAAAAYIMYFKPCPSSVKQFVNLTTEAEMGNLSAVLGRTKEINALIAKLRNNEAVLCVGDSGVGKSEIIKGLAIKIANGDVPSELKGNKIFAINTARLVGAKPTTTLAKVEKRLEGYENDVIIFFDEFHAAWFEDKKVAQDLKTFMDRFPKCIGATTLDEFTQHEIGNDSAIIRRMGIAKDASNGFIVNPMQPPQVKMVLRAIAESIAPDVEIKDEILSYLLQELKETYPEKPQLYTAKLVIAESVKRILHDPKSILQHRIAELKQEVEIEKSAYLQGKEVSAARAQVSKLKEQISETKILLNKQNKKVLEIKRLQKLWSDTRQHIFRTAEKITTAALQNASTEALKKEWIIYSQFVLPALQELMDEHSKAQELGGIKTQLDKDLIDEIIAEKIAYRQAT